MIKYFSRFFSIRIHLINLKIEELAEMISLQFIRSQCDLGAVGQRSYILFLDTGKDEKKKN